jgi:hypothetical protein
MSYLACHVQKFGMSAIKGIQRHNQREVEPENSSNKEINWDKTHENYDLKNDENINFYTSVKDRIAEGRSSDKALRKDAVVAVGVLVTSDKEFFERLGEEGEKRFFKASYDFVKERYGEENVISARIHKDESTPHMHVTVVPLTKDGRLSAKEIFDRNELRSLQTDFAKHLQKEGFKVERGVESDKKHVETREYKRQELEREKELMRKINPTYNKVNKINDQSKNTVFGNRVTLPKEEYEKLVDMALAAAHKKVEIDNIKNALRKQENITVMHQNTLQWSSKRNEELERKIRDLETYKKTVKDLNAMFKNNPELGEKVVESLKIHREKEKTLEKERERGLSMGR